MKMADQMKVLFLAAEAAPYIKIGGLADVAGALPRTLRELPKQPDVRLVIPLHKQIDRTKLPRKQVAAFEVEHKDGPLKAEVYETKLEGLPVYLIFFDSMISLFSRSAWSVSRKAILSF